MADANFDKTSLLLPLNGANNGLIFKDYSANCHPVSAGGNAKTSTGDFKYYDSSAYFDGTGDYLRIPYLSSLDLGSGDFTIEAWIKVTAYRTYTAHICGTLTSGTVDGGTNTAGWQFGVTSAGLLILAWGNNGSKVTIVSSSNAVGTGSWVHVAAVRSGTTVKLYINGTEDGSATFSTNITVSKWYFYVGSYNLSTSPFEAGVSWYGYLQDIRLKKGESVYTSGFTPPGKMIGYSLSGTVLDANGDPAARTVSAHCRQGPKQTAVTTSDGDTGAYSFTELVETEHFIVCQDDAAGDDYNDLILRATPE